MFSGKKNKPEVQAHVEDLVIEVVAPEKSLTPVAEESIETPSAEEEFILNEIQVAEQALISYRRAQQLEDTEQQTTLASIADIEHSCNLLPEGLAARKHLENKLTLLRSKLSGLNVKKQASEAAQAPILASISELEESLTYLDADSQAAVLLREQLDSLALQLIQVQQETADTTEAELCANLSVLRKRFVKCVIEQVAQRFKKQFVKELDENVFECKSQLESPDFIEQNIKYLGNFLDNPREFIESMGDSMYGEVKDAVDAAIIELNAKVSEAIALLTDKFDEEWDKQLITELTEDHLQRIGVRVEAKLEDEMELHLSAIARHNEKLISKAKVQKKAQESAEKLNQWLAIHKELKPSEAKDYAYYKIKHYEALHGFHKNMLSESLDKYSLVEEYVERYEQTATEKNDNYRNYVGLQSEIDNANNDADKEILEIKQLICYLEIARQTLLLQSLHLRIINVLKDQNEDREGLLSPVFTLSLFYALYQGELSEYLSKAAESNKLTEQIESITQSCAENVNKQEELSTANTDLAKCISEIFLVAMRIHVRSCKMSDTPKTKKFSSQMILYQSLISEYSKHHDLTYCKSDQPPSEFQIGDHFVRRLSELIDALPKSPIRSFHEVIAGYEFSETKNISEESDEEDDDWGIATAAHDDEEEERDEYDPNWEQSGVNCPPPPPPLSTPRSVLEEQEVVDDADEQLSHRSSPVISM